MLRMSSTIILPCGRTCFEWEVLDEFSGSQEYVVHALNVAEEYQILKHDSMNPDKGYNSTAGGYSSDKFAEHIKRRLRAKSGAKMFLQYDLDGNFVKEFSSLNAICAEFNVAKLKSSTILKPTWKGYMWREKKNEYFPRTVPAYVLNRGESQWIPCAVYDTSTGDMVECFNKLVDARKYSYNLGELKGTVVELNLYHPNDYILVKGDNLPLHIDIRWKHKKEKVVVPKPVKSISVAYYDREGNLVSVYDSIAEAAKATGWEYEKIYDHTRAIKYLCKKNTVGFWKRVDGDVLQKIDVIEIKHKTVSDKRIVQYDMDGNFLAIWLNPHQAGIGIGKSVSALSSIGDNMCILRGFVWKKYNEDYLNSVDPSTALCLDIKKNPKPKKHSKPKEFKVPRLKKAESRDHSILQTDLNGNVINVWKNEYQASLGSGVGIAIIRKMLNGGITKRPPIYLWKRSESYNFK